jgi:hypothetical protein
MRRSPKEMEGMMVNSPSESAPRMCLEDVDFDLNRFDAIAQGIRPRHIHPIVSGRRACRSGAGDVFFAKIEPTRDRCRDGPRPGVSTDTQRSRRPPSQRMA